MEDQDTTNKPHVIDSLDAAQKPSKTPSFLKKPSKLLSCIIVAVLLVVSAGMYLFYGPDAVLRRSKMGVGEHIVMKTADGYVGQKKYDAIISALKTLGYKDTADSKNNMLSAQDQAHSMLASEGYLSNKAKSAKATISSSALNAKLKTYYGSKSSEEFYKQYKNPVQMLMYYTVDANISLYKASLETSLIKGKQGTAIRVTLGDFKPGTTNAVKSEAYAAIKKDIDDNFRPSLLGGTTRDTLQKAISSKQLKSVDSLVKGKPTITVESRFYPKYLLDTQDKKLKSFVAPTTDLSLMTELKQGEVSAFVLPAFNGGVVARNDSDLTKNAFYTWAEMLDAALKSATIY